MLTLRNDLSIGGSRYRSVAVLERRFRALVGIRDRLAFDTRFSAGASGRATDVGHVFIIVEGRIKPLGAPSLEGPVGFLLRDDEIERPVPGRALTFRTDGECCAVIHLSMQRSMVVRPSGLSHGSLPLGAGTVQAARRITDCVMTTMPTPRHFEALFEGLATDGVVSPRLSATIVATEAERFSRLAAALTPFYSRSNASLSLKELATSLGISTSQLARDAVALCRAFGLPVFGFRNMARLVRLRICVLLLGAPGSTVSTVAEIAGYGSTIAMDRAFRDAHLPSPSEVQRVLRSPPP